MKPYTSVWASSVDALLETSVVGSFSNLGPLFRHGLGAWQPPPADSMRGRVVVITGATSGIGWVTARALAWAGAHVEIVARNLRKVEKICRDLEGEIPGSHISYAIADMGSLATVREAAAELLSRHQRIDVLIHNAGALDPTRTVTAEGLEQTVATHVVGPFLLSHLLLPALRAAAPSRILWVSSGGMYAEGLSVDLLASQAKEGQGYDGVKVYARAKRAQVVLSQMMAERWRSDGVHVHAMHPGWVDTPGLARSLPAFRRWLSPFLRTPAQGADTLIWLASDDQAPLETTGLFWLDRAPRPIHRLERTRLADTTAERHKLWEWGRTSSGLFAVSEMQHAPS